MRRPASPAPRISRFWVIAMCATIPVGIALAQRALDSNLRVGSGGRNSRSSANFPVSAPSPYKISAYSGGYRYNWASATSAPADSAFSSPFRSSNTQLVNRKGAFPQQANRKQGGALVDPLYSTRNISAGRTLPPPGVSGLQTKRYSPVAVPTTLAVPPKGSAKGLQRGTYTPISSGG